jgi:hypothetical protein
VVMIIARFADARRRITIIIIMPIIMSR